jgi:thiamine biosynthesis lipoprotein
LNEKDNMIQFMLSGMKIDLGGIAKGYALDCAIDKIKKSGIKSCLINAGGQVSCIGGNFGRSWQIAMKDPRGQGFVGYFDLEDKSIATSGDYEQYFIKNGRRYSHILNPKTGEPAQSGISSVAVIACDGLTADALATAIFVLGKTKGMALADKFRDVQVKIIEEGNLNDGTS